MDTLREIARDLTVTRSASILVSTVCKLLGRAITYGIAETTLAVLGGNALVMHFIYSEPVFAQTSYVLAFKGASFEPSEARQAAHPRSLVFLLNDSKDMVGFKVSFVGAPPGCLGDFSAPSSQNSIETATPLAPSMFATLCFPEAGEFTVSAYSARGLTPPRPRSRMQPDEALLSATVRVFEPSSEHEPKE